MFVKKAIYDEWINGKNSAISIEDIDWKLAEKLLLQLDGEQYTIITFTDFSEDNYICIGGGNNGLYNVYASLNDNEKLCELKNKNDMGKNGIELITGGQLGLFSKEDCVTLEIARVAIEKFFKFGEIFQELDWNISG